MISTISVTDIEAARARLPGFVCPTPLVESATLSELTGEPVYLKLEHLQNTGSFKLRGASNAISQLDDKRKSAGIVGVSTGNHGRGLAYAAKQAGISASIFMSELVPDVKVNAIRNLGAKIIIAGACQDDAEAAALKYCAESGATYLSPFDQPDVICGQGTLGLEIMEQLPSAATLLVPLSGGGLISGIALAVKAQQPGCKVHGVTMEKGPAMHDSLLAGKPVFVEEYPTFADSLGGGIGLNNRYTFNLVRDYVDEKLLVCEADIADAVRHAYFNERQIIEGGASVGIAVLLTGKIKPQGPTVIVLSGCNIDMAVHKAILDGASNLSEI